MQMGLYIGGEEKTERKRLLKAGGIILWVLMIGVSIILAAQSLNIAG